MLAAKVSIPFAVSCARRQLHASSSWRARRARGGTLRTTHATQKDQVQPTPTSLDWLLSSNAHFGTEDPAEEHPLLARPAAPPDELFDLDEIPDATVADMSPAGHKLLAQERQVLNYLRLIDGDVQNLKELRRPYNPPARGRKPIVVRSISYGNEQHPAARKKTLVVPLMALPLVSTDAVHKFIALAGVHWTADPPKNSGIGQDELISPLGYFKLSCERFPEPAMNLKWALDTLNRLVKEANDLSGETFLDIPLDFRPEHSQRMKHRKGGHRAGLMGRRPSLRDFPIEWLPDKYIEEITRASQAEDEDDEDEDEEDEVEVEVEEAERYEDVDGDIQELESTTITQEEVRL